MSFVVDFTKCFTETYELFKNRDEQLFQSLMNKKITALQCMANNVKILLAKANDNQPVRFAVSKEDWLLIGREFKDALPKGFCLEQQWLPFHNKHHCTLYYSLSADFSDESLFSFDIINWKHVIETCKNDDLYKFVPERYVRHDILAKLQQMNSEFASGMEKASAARIGVFTLDIPESPSDILHVIFKLALPDSLTATIEEEPFRSKTTTFKITRTRRKCE